MTTIIVIYREAVLKIQQETRQNGRREGLKKKDEKSPVTYRGRKQIRDCGIVLLCGKSETKTYTEVIFKFQVDATF